jgi:hypothetical protein
MAIWTIQNLECLTSYNDTENVVISIQWKAQSSRVIESVNRSVTRIGKTDIIIGEGPLIPFDELTQQIVLDWLYNKIGDDKLGIELDMQLELDNLENPQKTTLAPPWE